jgi:hypothetical protein
VMWSPAPPLLLHPSLSLSLFLYIEITFHVWYATLLVYALFDWRLIRVHIKLVRLLFMFTMLLSSDFFYLEA